MCGALAAGAYAALRVFIDADHSIDPFETAIEAAAAASAKAVEVIQAAGGRAAEVRAAALMDEGGIR